MLEMVNRNSQPITNDHFLGSVVRNVSQLRLEVLGTMDIMDVFGPS